MNVKNLGEFGLIHRIAPLFNSDLPQGVEGIGNDCAVIPFCDNLSYLITTDLLNENVHFIVSKMNPHDLGYKSLAVSLSDLAAMGGKPHYAFLSIGLPSNTSVEWIDAFFLGFHQLAKQTNLFLLGGDTTRADKIVINVLVIGMAEISHIKRRSQAQIGDIICCTGYLGDSGAGLKILLEELPQDSITQPLIEAHIRPRPHLEEGAWLATQSGVHAMMDVSDGIQSDLHRIMEESHCGVHIRIEDLPLSSHLKQICTRFNWQPEELALTGGEDYCLLATIHPKNFPFVQEAYFKHFQSPLFSLGTVSASSSLTHTFHGKPFILQSKEFNHFKPE